jgi:hypothetical protein
MRGERQPTRAAGVNGRRLVLLFALALIAVLVTASVAEARTVRGTAKADTLRGTAKADRIFGLGGKDVIRAANGGRDRINCGSGFDRVTADASDSVASNCEKVTRPGTTAPTGATAPPPAMPGMEHPGGMGFLPGPGAWGELDFVSKLPLATSPDLIADVAVSPDGNFAYLANWGEPDCAAVSEAGGINSPDAGAYVVDISDLENPTFVTFIPHSQDSRPGEGMQVIDLSTRWFTGQVLVMNNEQCGFQGKGGLSLWNVTNPAKPMKLSEHFGDKGFADVNEIHSAFAWDTGDKAYAVMTDNIESTLTDVDVMDITNPHRPRLIAEYALNDFDIFQPDIGLQDSNLHDMVVKQIDGHWIMLLSYWDGGYVQLNVDDPANPVFLGDTEYATVDPELLESAGIVQFPEGNAHQAEFTSNNAMFIATDEDFAPYRPDFKALYGPTAADDKEYFAGEFGWTTPIVNEGDGRINGPTVYGGYGCPAGPAVPAAAGFAADPGEDKVLVLQRGPVGDPDANFEACFFSEKVEVAQNAGWDAVVIANHHVGSGEGELPDAHLCGSQGHVFTPTIPGVCVGHRALHELFADAPSYEVPYEGSEPAVGTVGSDVDIPASFDGWGYVHLFDAQATPATPPNRPHFAELDTYAIDEAHMEEHAQGFGDLTVHEVATDPQNARRAYLSYYAGGMIALDIVCGATEASCELDEVGGYREADGNDFWGVEAFVRDGTTYVLGSARDFGLYIFKRD